MSEKPENKDSTTTQEEKKMETSENPKTSIPQPRKSSTSGNSGKENYDISYEDAIFQRKQESFLSFDGWENNGRIRIQLPEAGQVVFFGHLYVPGSIAIYFKTQQWQGIAFLYLNYAGKIG